MLRKLVPMLFAGVLGSACAGEVAYTGTVSATYSTPDMVAVGNGVSVIADYDEPIFYSSGYYWYPSEYGWYRSSSYTGGWVYVERPPSAIISIRSPNVYRHYRPHNYVVRHRPVPAARIERPRYEARNHRHRY